MSEALERAGCDEKCWTLAKCPSCDSTMPPRGRAASLEWHIGECCETWRHDIVANPAHYWSRESGLEEAEWLEERS